MDDIADSSELDELFRQAAIHGDVDEMRALRAQGANVNSDQPPLSHAVSFGRTAAVQYLIDNGADVNTSDVHGGFPLHSAGLWAHNEIMGLLLAAGADVHVTNEHGATPLYYLTEYGTGNRARCAELLLSHGARVDDAARHGGRLWTPLRSAIYGGSRSLVKVFLRGGAREFATDVGHAVALADDLPIRRPHNKSAFEVVDAIQAAGGWAEYVKAHRRVLSSLVSKLSAKNTTRPIPLDAASHLVGFWCPPGGY